MALLPETKSPIELLTALLGEMTARATEAERQRDAEIENSRIWYEQCQLRKDELKEAKQRIEELERDMQEAIHCIDDLTAKLDKVTKTKQGS